MIFRKRLIIILVGIYNQFQGTVLLMVVDFQVICDLIVYELDTNPFEMIDGIEFVSKMWVDMWPLANGSGVFWGW